MEIKMMNVDELIPYEKNPRNNTKAVNQVANSIKAFGFNVPVVIDKNKVVVCGHTRIKACKKLGLSNVPCVMVDKLTPKQIRAFRLAENKVSEKASWDFKLLELEINDLVADFNMADFGFNFDVAAKKEKNVDDTKQKETNILNLNRRQYDGVGYYDIPELLPISAADISGIEEWIGFNYVLSDEHPENKGVHFFVSDYQFERLWNNPDKYINKLLNYRAVLTPDFSPYGDMPLVTQLYNHYRKHWVGALMQEAGVNVIPTIRASTDLRSFDWYLDGEPKGGVVAISSMWCGDPEIKSIFMREYNTMYARLKPEKVFIYGDKIEGLPGKIEYIKKFTKKWSGV